MKRSDFLKKLGIGLGVAVIAPSVVANNATSEEGVYEAKLSPEVFDWYKKTRDAYTKYPATYDECYPSECWRVKFYDKQNREVVDLTLNQEWTIRFWDTLTLDRDYIVTERASNYWKAIEA